MTFLLSITVALKFHNDALDIKGAYLQSGSTKRNIYVCPFFEVNIEREKLWLPRKLPYEIAEADRQ